MAIIVQKYGGSSVSDVWRIRRVAERVQARRAEGQTWNPSLEEPKRAEMYRLWKKAVTRSFDWVE